MKQEVHFIFKNRERNTTESAVPENAVNMVEEVIASMTRSTYDRGSLSAHQERGKKAFDQLKRYVDVVLHDHLVTFADLAPRRRLINRACLVGAM